MDVLNHTGYFYLRKNEMKKAIAVFKLAIREYPDAFNPYDSLGDAYLTNNDKENAILFFTKALELKENPYTRNKLESLKNK